MQKQQQQQQKIGQRPKPFAGTRNKPAEQAVPSSTC